MTWRMMMMMMTTEKVAKWTEMNRKKKRKNRIMDNSNRKEWEIGSFAAIRPVLPVKGGI